MTRIFLQNMVEAIPDDCLSANWADLDLVSFSADKTLWDYQQKALRNALKLLWKYYEDFGDYVTYESPKVNRDRKKKLWEWYRDNGLDDDFSIDLARLKHEIAWHLRECYEPDGNLISYEQLVNRMSFWMATGSGKTLVLIKLIELLSYLICRREIPDCDILFLTHRDDLIEQFLRHVEEFSKARGDLIIVPRELKEYADAKREAPSLFRKETITIFYYRADNLSDKQKEKIVDFRNYDNEGRWYVLLDEAHKGDREDSKRQHIYSMLSRNGFLINFSATFTDPRDIATTVFNFNLSEYIQAGYGKHIAVLKQEMRPFRDTEDYTGEEKEKVVLKALMMLVYVRKIYEAARSERDGWYHKPLMLVLVNSVNTDDSDLELFFRELRRIGKWEVRDEVFEQAKGELLEELQARPPFLFEHESLMIDDGTLRSMTPDDLLNWVFNSEKSGEMEVLVRPSNRQEMAFKLKTFDRPFALIKIGDISGWLKQKLTGYEINESFENESYFARLNDDDSDITILMGSRTFYEGWDSNRPNVICYINIGVGEDARKFILQSVGRGARIEPMKNKRKRLLALYNAGEIDKGLFHEIRDRIQLLETLFIFGTNRQALQVVIEGLRQGREETVERQINLFEVNPEARSAKLLIPIYKQAKQSLMDVRWLAKFEVDQEEFRAMREFVETTDDRTLLMLCDTSHRCLGNLRWSLLEPDRFYSFTGRRYGDLLRLLGRALGYFGVVSQELDHLKELEEEIRHFRHITVSLADITELESKIKRVRDYRDPTAMEEELKEKFQRGEISLDEFMAAIKQTTQMAKEERFEFQGKRITIKHIAQHYYLPVVLSEGERVDYIRHIIKTPSEVKFVRDLESYLSQSNHKFREFDWWLFSKLDESLDEVYLPYFDPKSNRTAKFKPDFIFWLQKGGWYFIVFVDPKGTEHTDWIRKVEGYRAVFMKDGAVCPTSYKGLTVTVHLFMRTDDLAKVPGDYQEFWFDSIDGLLDRLLRGLGPCHLSH